MRVKSGIPDRMGRRVWVANGLEKLEAGDCGSSLGRAGPDRNRTEGDTLGPGES